MSLSYTRRSFWIAPLALLISIALRALPSPWIEAAYARGFFPVLRTVWDHSLGFSPVPLFYLFWAGVIVGLVGLVGAVRKRRGLWPRLARLAGLLFRFTCWLGVAFLWLWGFNYGRLSVEESMDFTVYEPSLEELKERVRTEADSLARLRATWVGFDTSSVKIQADFGPFERDVRDLLAQSLRAEGYPTPGRPRGRKLYPKGLLLRIGTSGIYWPWVAEGHFDAGLHPLKHAPVLAHELAHAYGFGEEGTCTFWAWMVGQRAQDPAIAYAIRLDYWRDLARRWLRADRAGYLTFFRESLDPGIRQDIIAIIQTNRQYPDLMPALRDVAYDAYLKSQGVRDGLLSYGRVVQLVEGYRRRK